VLVLVLLFFVGPSPQGALLLNCALSWAPRDEFSLLANASQPTLAKRRRHPQLFPAGPPMSTQLQTPTRSGLSTPPATSAHCPRQRPQPAACLRNGVGRRLLMVLGDLQLCWPGQVHAAAGLNGSGNLATTAMFVISTLLFAVMFVLPDAHTAWRDVPLAPPTCLLAWQLCAGALSVHAGPTYGAVASFAVFLLWVFYSAQIFFFGAEFAKIYSRR
jgi:hypothetical protein